MSHAGSNLGRERDQMYDEAERLRAQQNRLAKALRDMLDLHDPHGKWEQDEANLNEVAAMRVTAAAEALREIEEES